MDILQQLKETETEGLYEIIFEDDNDGNREELRLKELQHLNLAGYLYTGSQTEIDFEDIDENGNTVTRYMDIHYFAQIDLTEVNLICDEHFPA